MTTVKQLLGSALVFAMISCQAKEKEMITEQITEPIVMEIKDGLEVATFAGGCFWCTEAVFLELDGVKSVKSGYIGGKTGNPDYIRS